MKSAIILKNSFLVFLLLSTVACSKFGLEIGLTNPLPLEDTPTKSENPVTAASDPREVVEKAYKNLFSARSYRARSVASLGKAKITTNIEFAAPDRLHSVQDATGIEIIVVGKNTYMKTPGSKWERSPLNLGETLPNFQTPEMSKELSKNDSKNTGEVKVIGADTIDGIPVIVYQSSNSANDSNTGKITATIKYWIGVKDNLLYRTETEIEGNFLGEKSRDKTTASYYDYGADIKIESPI